MGPLSSKPGASIYSGAFTSWRGPSAWVIYADTLAVLTAAMLPWSTTAVAVLIVLWLLSLIPLLPTLDVRGLLSLLARSACLFPLAIFALAVVGTLWADGPWPERLRSVSPVFKLLVIPILLYHFERSQRGHWVLIAFVASCGAVLVCSWVVLFAPQLKMTVAWNAGVPVKNYIDQSQEFALCMVGLAPFTIRFYRERRFALAAACAVLILGFFTNMAFVVSARAALFYLPVMLILFAFMHLNRRSSVFLLIGIVAAATVVWFNSSYLRGRIADISTEYQNYQQNISGSAGLRLEYWQKSLRFFAQSPIFGNGTGSTKQLFDQAAAGQTGLAAEVTPNPHNQTLSVAVQWGITGVVLLYAMWLAHLLLFRGSGLANWMGLLVVVQNMTSSLFNSHLFDFHEGWMYVLGVGVAGGMSLGARRLQQK
jgi:O-antigen ligase